MTGETKVLTDVVKEENSKCRKDRDIVNDFKLEGIVKELPTLDRSLLLYVKQTGYWTTVHVEDTGNNIYVDDGSTGGNAGNVYNGYIDTHADALTWSVVVIGGTTGGMNVSICTSYFTYRKYMKKNEP